MWSTTDQIRGLDTAIMFGVMIGLGVLTYTVVFNLNNLTRAVYRQYETAKRPWIRKMMENGGVWKDRAAQYNSFKIKRFDASPSEWLVIWYILIWPVRLCLRSIKIYATADQSTLQRSTERPDKAKGTNDLSDEGWLKDHPPFPHSEDSKCLSMPMRVHVLLFSSLSFSTTDLSAFFIFFKCKTEEF